MIKKIVLRVHNLSRAEAFYVEVLKLRVRRRNWDAELRCSFVEFDCEPAIELQQYWDAARQRHPSGIAYVEIAPDGAVDLGAIGRTGGQILADEWSTLWIQDPAGSHILLNREAACPPAEVSGNGSLHPPDLHEDARVRGAGEIDSTRVASNGRDVPASV
jgi:catechol 2,3-dioxygenase-like lactoylglutathione lyase family enzyme